MKLLYSTNETSPGQHKIFYAVLDRDLFLFSDSTNIPLSPMEVDEVMPDNQDICKDLILHVNGDMVDDSGDGKYHIKIEDGEPTLHENDGWIQREEFDL